MEQHAISADRRDSDGFGPFLQLPFVLCLHKALTDDKVEAVVVS